MRYFKGYKVGLALIAALLWLGMPSPALAQSCASPDLDGGVGSDTTLSGDVYVGGNVTVDNDAVLTFQPGTEVIICPDDDDDDENNHQILVQDAKLIANGTAENPIVFRPEGAGEVWRGIEFGDGGNTPQESELRYVEVVRGGKKNTTNTGAIEVYAPDITEGDGPVFDHVTITDSTSYGIYVRTDDDDDSPLSLSNLTITGSAEAPLMLFSAAMIGLGGGNTLSGNARDVIEVRGGVVVGGRQYFDQTWVKQPVPFFVPENNEIRVNHSENLPALSIEAGNELIFGENAFILVARGSLVVSGTAESPVVMRSVDDNSYWRGIYMGGGGVTVQESELRYVEIHRGGDSGSANTGAVEIYAPDHTVDDGPVLDHVTITESAAYGIYVRIGELDSTPLSMANLTINDSAEAPLMLHQSAIKGLGAGNSFSGNGNNVIEARGGEVIHFNQTWVRQPIPFYIPDNHNLRVTHADNLPVLTIEAGNVVEMGSDAAVWVSHGGLVLQGTENAPVIFRSHPDSTGLWDRILIDDRFSPSKSEMRHVQIAGSAHSDGAIQGSESELTVEHATIEANAGAGIRLNEGYLRLTDSTLSNNDLGVRFMNGAAGVLRNNAFISNANGALDNSDTPTKCVDAAGNYWGSAGGPADSSGDEDVCGQTVTNDGGGQSVTDNVIYSPWYSTAEGSDLADASSITPQDLWVLADGVQSTQIEVVVRDAQGQPLANKDVQLTSTLGDLVQPTQPTDDQGRTFAAITSEETGSTLIRAHNTTDNQPLAALGSIYFWRGPGDAGGLIDPSGIPYAAPDFIVEGEPFQAGLPIVFSLPMQNTQSAPISVTVDYGATNLGIGQRFTTVESTSRTLQPGESWEAPATWAPSETGHQCVEALLTYDFMDGSVVQQADVSALLADGSLRRQRNLDHNEPDDPCDEPDATKLIPTRGGLPGVYKHFGNASDQANKVNGCLQTVGFRAAAADQASPGSVDQRDYEVVVTPPAFTPPELTTGPEVNAAQAEAANQVAEITAEIAGLRVAVDEALLRVRQAGQADDPLAVRLQLSAYQDYRSQYKTQLTAYADAIDDLLVVTRDAGMPDVSLTLADYSDYLDQLKNTGYNGETESYYKTSGLSDSAIADMLAADIAQLEQGLPAPGSVYTKMQRIRDAARAEADNIPTAVRQAANGPLQIDYQPSSFSFEVGNPTDSTATVELRVRPVSLPVGWSYDLDNGAPELEAGETTTATLTIVPSGTLMEGVTPQLAVEGFIDDEYIGGILVESGISVSERKIYLPAVQKAADD